MFRRSSARLLAFAELLCGENIADAMSTRADCDRTVAEFRRLSATAPLPVPMAVALTATRMRDGAYRDAAAVVAAYHRPRELVDGLAECVRRDPQAYGAECLRSMTDLLRTSSAPGVTSFLMLLAECSLANDAEHPHLKADARLLIQLHIRFHPSSAAALLRPLCLVSSAGGTERDDILEVVQIAMRGGGFVDPADFAAVLAVFLRARDHRRIVTLWAWMQHTSAAWDREAASAAICAAAELRYLDDAVACIHSLAEAGHDPTPQAQEALIRFLGARSPPLPTYADQLAGLWYGEGGGGLATSPALWADDGQAVAVSLLFAHFRSQNHLRVLELLAGACEAWAGLDSAAAEAETGAFLGRRGVPVLMRHYRREIVASPALMRVFFDGPQRLGGAVLAANPTLTSAFALVGSAADRMGELRATLAAAASALGDNGFGEFLTFAAEELLRGMPPLDVLVALRAWAADMDRPVPADISGWLQLRAEEQQAQAQPKQGPSATE